MTILALPHDEAEATALLQAARRRLMRRDRRLAAVIKAVGPCIYGRRPGRFCHPLSFHSAPAALRQGGGYHRRPPASGLRRPRRARGGGGARRCRFCRVRRLAAEAQLSARPGHGGARSADAVRRARAPPGRGGDRGAHGHQGRRPLDGGDVSDVLRSAASTCCRSAMSRSGRRLRTSTASRAQRPPPRSPRWRRPGAPIAASPAGTSMPI